MESEELKRTVASNLVALRKKSGMTQLDLAEALNYTDKAVSKWERAESLPDVVILKRIADLFGVTVDYLLSNEHPDELADAPLPPAHRFRNHAVITGISVALVWLIATLVFSTGGSVLGGNPANFWLVFLYAVPVSCVVWLVFNTIWFNRKRNYLIISLLMWSALAAIHISFLVAGNSSVWLIYLLGIPGQIIIVIWSRFRHRWK